MQDDKYADAQLLSKKRSELKLPKLHEFKHLSM